MVGDQLTRVGFGLQQPGDDHGIEDLYSLFGQERITLEFCDVASLERLRDVAGEGARLLGEALQANAHEGDPAASAD
jgi:hypothetical protein